MHANAWYVALLCFLPSQESIYARPATSPPSAPLSLPASRAQRREPHEIEWVRLDGTKYNLTAVPLEHWMDPERFPGSYKITDGFQLGNKRVPAILKRIPERKPETEDSKTHEEIEFLQRDSVGLYLFHQWSKRKDKDGNYAVSIVMRDVEEDDPPFKTFYMWYLEDKTISALEGLRAARENIATRLLWYAKEEYLVYHEINRRNILLRKVAISEQGVDDSSVRVMPVNWTPNQGRPNGVEDIEDQNRKANIFRQYDADLRLKLEFEFSVEKLYNDLEKNGHELRRDDIRQEELDGKTYDLVHIKKSLQDNNHTRNTYTIIGGFNGYPAHMRCVQIDTQSEGERVLQEFAAQGWTMLGSKLSTNEACFIYDDHRGRNWEVPEM